MRAALDSGAFDTFHFPDGMISAQRWSKTSVMRKSTVRPVSIPARLTELAAINSPRWLATAFDATSPFTPEGYDSAASDHAGHAGCRIVWSPSVYKEHIMHVANAPGEPIAVPASLARHWKSSPVAVMSTYVGATNVELIGPG